MGTARLWQAASSLVLADYSSECGFQLSSLIAVGFFITWPFSKKPPFKILEFGHIHSGFLQHCAVLSNNWNICCYWKYQLFFFFWWQCCFVSFNTDSMAFLFFLSKQQHSWHKMSFIFLVHTVVYLLVHLSWTVIQWIMLLYVHLVPLAESQA